MDKGIYTNVDPYHNGRHKQPFPLVFWIRILSYIHVILSYIHVHKHIHRGDIYSNVYLKNQK